jgi:hypothetical protein
MATMHVCIMRFAQSRTGEIRRIVTKAHIQVVPTLRTDLISVKSLNPQGHRVIHDVDPKESGIFPVLNGKIGKSKSFAFMSEHSSNFHIKAKAMLAQQFGKIMAQKAGSYYK